MISNIIQKHPKKTLIISYIFSIFMIILLHAALTTLINRKFEHQTNILAQELSENIYSNKLSTEEISKFIENYPATKIIIYDTEQKQSFASNDKTVLLSKDCRIMDYVAKLFLPKINKNISDALDGNFFSQIIWSANLNKEDKKLPFLKVTTPITNHFNQKHEKIYGVLEVYFDISYDLRMYNNTRFFGIVLITIMFFMFFILHENKNSKPE